MTVRCAWLAAVAACTAALPAAPATAASSVSIRPCASDYVDTPGLRIGRLKTCLPGRIFTPRGDLSIRQAHGGLVLGVRLAIAPEVRCAQKGGDPAVFDGPVTAGGAARLLYGTGGPLTFEALSQGRRDRYLVQKRVRVAYVAPGKAFVWYSARAVLIGGPTVCTATASRVPFLKDETRLPCRLDRPEFAGRCWPQSLASPPLARTGGTILLRPVTIELAQGGVDRSAAMALELTGSFPRRCLFSDGRAPRVNTATQLGTLDPNWAVTALRPSWNGSLVSGTSTYRGVKRTLAYQAIPARGQIRIVKYEETTVQGVDGDASGLTLTCTTTAANVTIGRNWATTIER